MCIMCADEALVAAGVVIAAAPWYRTILSKLVTICKRNLA